MSMGKDAVQQVKDIVTGMVTGGASLAGWSAGEAVLLGAKAEEATTARLALGQDFNAAVDASIAEAEMVLVMDVFCKALAETGDADAAFDKVVAMKMQAAGDAPGNETAQKVARATYADAIKGGLAPQAAMLSAFLSAGATMRLAASGAAAATH
ncbi:hypothetical protein [Stappia sp.]|uniref:hypothetical protein n=1 Tax=Stappia sp. TaxID=1870903 RepID=UPI0032D91D05